MSKRAMGWCYFIDITLGILSSVLFLAFQGQQSSDSSLMNGYIHHKRPTGRRTGKDSHQKGQPG